jgi:hypothetical protein
VPSGAATSESTRWFKQVLDGWYNAAHRDHMHLDDGGGAQVFNRSCRSDTVFIHAAANVMIDANLAIDGLYGPNTQAAFSIMRDRLGIPNRVSVEAAEYRRSCGGWPTVRCATVACEPSRGRRRTVIAINRVRAGRHSQRPPASARRR